MQNICEGRDHFHLVKNLAPAARRYDQQAFTLENNHRAFYPARISIEYILNQWLKLLKTSFHNPYLGTQFLLFLDNVSNTTVTWHLICTQALKASQHHIDTFVNTCGGCFFKRTSSACNVRFEYLKRERTIRPNIICRFIFLNWVYQNSIQKFENNYNRYFLKNLLI